MIVGAHSIIYSKDAEADRAFLRDVLGLGGVDVGGGWLIFGLPPAEVAVHPAEKNDVHELFFLCADVDRLVLELARSRVACTPVETLPWGRLTRVTLPGGGRLGIYEPRHARPAPATAGMGQAKRRVKAKAKPKGKATRPATARAGAKARTARGGKAKTRS